MTRDKTTRTYEAIYAAAFVREFCECRDRIGAGIALGRVVEFHEEAQTVANSWLEMVQAAEGEQG